MNSYSEGKKIFDSMTGSERVILYCIGSSNEPLKSKVKIQKLIFLCVQALPDVLDEEFNFSTHKKGPYSQEVDETVLTFNDYGLINANYSLTLKGKDTYSFISPHQILKEVIYDNEEFIEGLNEDEILTYIYLTYPQSRIDSEEWSRLKNNLGSTIVSLLQKGKISFSRAAELSGMNSVTYAEYLKKNKIRWRDAD